MNWTITRKEIDLIASWFAGEWSYQNGGTAYNDNSFVYDATQKSVWAGFEGTLKTITTIKFIPLTPWP